MKFDKLINSPVVELVFMAGLIIMYTLLNVVMFENIQRSIDVIIASVLTSFTIGFITALFERELYSELKEKILSSVKEDR